MAEERDDQIKVKGRDITQRRNRINQRNQGGNGANTLGDFSGTGANTDQDLSNSNNSASNTQLGRKNSRSPVTSRAEANRRAILQSQDSLPKPRPRAEFSKRLGDTFDLLDKDIIRGFNRIINEISDLFFEDDEQLINQNIPNIVNLPDTDNQLSNPSFNVREGVTSQRVGDQTRVNLGGGNFIQSRSDSQGTANLASSITGQSPFIGVSSRTRGPKKGLTDGGENISNFLEAARASGASAERISELFNQLPGVDTRSDARKEISRQRTELQNLVDNNQITDQQAFNRSVTLSQLDRDERLLEQRQEQSQIDRQDRLNTSAITFQNLRANAAKSARGELSDRQEREFNIVNEAFKQLNDPNSGSTVASIANTFSPSIALRVSPKAAEIKSKGLIEFNSSIGDPASQRQILEDIRLQIVEELGLTDITQQQLTQFLSI